MLTSNMPLKEKPVRFAVPFSLWAFFCCCFPRRDWCVKVARGHSETCKSHWRPQAKKRRRQSVLGWPASVASGLQRLRFFLRSVAVEAIEAVEAVEAVETC